MNPKTHFHPAVIKLAHGFRTPTTSNSTNTFTNVPGIATSPAGIERAGKSLSKAGPATLVLSATNSDDGDTGSDLVADPHRAFSRQASGLKSIFVDPRDHRL